MIEFDKDKSIDCTETDFEAQKAEFLRLIDEINSQNNTEEDPSIQKLREAGYDIDRIKKIFET